ncbi:hypothetical protein TNCV_111121 [Trichonephila clavipes]|nr:hypothetical protein TNCV_111121 [Trichonephila clavipes]
MDTIEYRTVIKYLFLKNNTPTQMKDELDSVYGDSAPSFTTAITKAKSFQQNPEAKREHIRSVQKVSDKVPYRFVTTSKRKRDLFEGLKCPENKLRKSYLLSYSTDDINF